MDLQLDPEYNYQKDILLKYSVKKAFGWFAYAIVSLPIFAAVIISSLIENEASYIIWSLGICLIFIFALAVMAGFTNLRDTKSRKFHSKYTENSVEFWEGNELIKIQKDKIKEIQMQFETRGGRSFRAANVELEVIFIMDDGEKHKMKYIEDLVATQRDVVAVFHTQFQLPLKTNKFGMKMLRRRLEFPRDLSKYYVS